MSGKTLTFLAMRTCWALLGKNICDHQFDPGIDIKLLDGANCPARGCVGNYWLKKPKPNYYNDREKRTKPVTELGNAYWATNENKFNFWTRLMVFLAILTISHICSALFDSKYSLLIDYYKTNVKISKYTNKLCTYKGHEEK